MRAGSPRTNDSQPSTSSLMAFFTSLRLTIALMIILAVVSVIGTVIPQNASPQEYLHHYGPTAYRIFKALGFPDVYHSWYFNVLLLLLSLNLLACSIRSFPRVWRAVTMRTPLLTDEQLRIASFTAALKKDLAPEAVTPRVVQILKARFSAPRETLHEGAMHLYCEKSRHARLGVYIVHLSVLLILLGGLIGSLGGFKGHLIIPEGQRSREVVLQGGSSVYEMGFEVRCDDFEVTYYPGGAPKDYKSTLTIVEGDTPVLTKVIEVNHPLSYKGLTFYQSSWGSLAEVVLAVAPKGDHTAAAEYRVREGESFTIPKSGLTVKLSRFFTDFVIEDGQPLNRSAESNNPAAELLIYQDDRFHQRTWVFKNFPDFHGAKDLDYEFTLKEFEQKEYTGLQVTKDPGVTVVWAGCSLMMLGILFTFFLSHRKVWVKITPSAGKTELALAGSASKNRLGFEKEFERLREEMEKIS